MLILGCLRMGVRDEWVPGCMISAGNDYELWACYAMACYVAREQGHRIGPLGLCSLGQRKGA
jgi:hypothetical protein